MPLTCEQIGTCTLYCGNCVALLPTLPRAAAIVSDPPYGMGWDTDSTRFTHSHNPARRRGPGRNDHVAILGDERPFDPTPWLTFPEVILWGSHHYANRLPVGTTLVWIKRFDQAFGSFLSDAELAWHKGGHGVYCYRDLFMNRETTTRQHPTQKPLGLMRWCLSRIRSPLIIDPYMGSGTTGVAALEAGRTFIGIELQPSVFATACRRLEAAASQLEFFPPAPARPAPHQLTLGGF